MYRCIINNNCDSKKITFLVEKNQRDKIEFIPYIIDVYKSWRVKKYLIKSISVNYKNISIKYVIHI